MTAVSVELVVEGMHCNSCGLLIDDTIEDLPGVARCATDVRRGRTLVTYDPTQVTPAEIAAAIVDSGYTVAPVDEGSG